MAIKFSRKNSMYGCFSNFFKSPVTFDGLTYKNSEAAWQAQKTLDTKQREVFTKLEGSYAKKAGRGRLQIILEKYNKEAFIMKRKITYAVMALITAGTLLTGCGLSVIPVPEYNAISQEEFWNGLSANGYSHEYDMTDSYKETITDTQYYDDAAYYYDGTTEFIFSDLSSSSAASYFFNNITEQYTDITDHQKTITKGSTEWWKGTQEDNNLSIVVYRVDDVVVTAVGTYDQAGNLNSIVEDILTNNYSQTAPDVENVQQAENQFGSNDVIQQEVNSAPVNNTQGKTITVGNMEVSIVGDSSWTIDDSYDITVPVQTEDGTSVVYSDSYIDTGDTTAIASAFETYGCTETSQVDINGRQSYVGYSLSTYGTCSVYVFQNIGGTSYLEIDITGTRTDVMEMVSEFALNL